MLFSNSLRVSFVYGWYVLDMGSFIEQLCKNKDKPEMQCNGKCYLTKMAADNSEEKNNTFPDINWEQLVYCPVAVSGPKSSVKPIIKKHQFWYVSLNSDDVIISIFRPPKYS